VKTPYQNSNKNSLNILFIHSNLLKKYDISFLTLTQASAMGYFSIFGVFQVGSTFRNVPSINVLSINVSIIYYPYLKVKYRTKYLQ